MEHRMRDLDQIQERDPDGAGRRLGTMIMAAVAFVGLSAAVGVVLGRAARPEPTSDALDPLASLSVEAQPRADREPIPTLMPAVEAAELSFPDTLTEREERPEVLAALAAAAEEEAALVDGPGPGQAEPGEADPGEADLGEADPGEADPEAAPWLTPAAAAEAEREAEPEPAIDRMPAAMPAAVAAGPAQRALAQAVKHDPLVEGAIPARPDGAARAPRGEEGEYTLQVISYDNQEAATRFAEGLRAKGHQAFVMEADIPDRGRYYRVRVGPFDSRFKASRYRREFEATERMNTFVVRRPKQD